MGARVAGYSPKRIRKNRKKLVIFLNRSRNRLVFSRDHTNPQVTFLPNLCV